MNILLTCAGRRNYLVEYFQEVLTGDGYVYAANSNSDSTAMIVAKNGFIVPSIYHPSYVDVLLKICYQYDIKAIIPLFDLELPILASAKERFEKVGITVIVSSSEVVDICLDKCRTSNFLEKINIRTPLSFFDIDSTLEAIKLDQIRYPLIIKPRWGMGSLGIMEANNDQELSFFYNKSLAKIKESYLSKISNSDLSKSVIIQEKIGGQEFGLDIINDLKGNYIVTLPKKKITMRSGETDGAMTVKNIKLEELGELIGRNLQHIANLDVDVFYNGHDYTVLEMNPRFGGGYPFSHLAGANLPAAIIQWIQGEEADKANFQIKPNVASYKGILPLVIKDNLVDFT